MGATMYQLEAEFEQYRHEFEIWARASGLLRPGTCFMTTFCVTGGAVVKELPETIAVPVAQDVLDMKLNEFFSRETAGQKGSVVRKLRRIHGRVPYGETKPLETVRDLVLAGRRNVLGLKSYGSATLKRIDEILKAAGIEWKD